MVLAALYQTIADVLGHLPRAWLDDILADEEVDEGSDSEKRRNLAADAGTGGYGPSASGV